MYEAVPGFSGGTVQAAGTWQLSAGAIDPWRGIFNIDNGIPDSAYVPRSFNVSWGNSNTPTMIDPNSGRPAYIQSWNLNIQRELWQHFVLDMGYVGNKSTGLYDGALLRLNQLPVSALAQYGTKLNSTVRSAADAAANSIAYPFPGFAGTVASALRQFPQVQGNSVINNSGAPLGFSNYHSLQVVLNRQFSSLSVYANYVYSKVLANISSAGGDGGRAIDTYNLKLEKSVTEYDVPHNFKAYAAYDLPVGRGRTVLGNASRIVQGLLGGWSISTILNYNSGLPIGFGASSPLSGGWNGAANRANVAPGDLYMPSFDKKAFNQANTSQASNTYFIKTKITDAPPLTLGTSAYRLSWLRGFGTINEDFALQKNAQLTEKVRFQLRGEFLNAFTRWTLNGPNTSVTSPNFGQITSNYGNRTIQFSTRIDF